ncbi:XRE family transcriptional regulator [Streptomyces sp. MST-110588]|uniref:helix-turn-helix domain-containing protein n=1 Tax=Streptomyces sp. MST-110588 TaxID=2833628 RepID=UPI001F5D89C9|nr:XRE family transcriptional regulator [Streptomyces sp. MST-110588]UNO40315.1 helix-turn-helix domain-containing protein [Streptomyces sp. MST-110588]
MRTEHPPSAECVRLAAGLRELRERTGLSLAGLAGRTPYSKSSWERYLNGKKLPPRQAVEALCRLAGEPAGRLLALWELAEQAWSGRNGTTAGTVAGTGGGARPGPEAGAGAEAGPGAGTGPGPDTGASTGTGEETRNGDSSGHRATGRVFGHAFGRPWPRGALFASATAVVVAAVVVPLLLTSAPGRHSADERTPAASAPPPGPTYEQSFQPGCTGRECEGQDAYEMGCGAQGLAVSLLKRTAAGGQRVEIRYGAKCGAVWARTMNLRVGDQVELSLPGADPKKLRAVGQRDTEVYRSTAMTATGDPGRATVCLSPATGAKRECFSPPSSVPPSGTGEAKTPEAQERPST